MRNYMILWIILGLGVFLFLQSVPTGIMGQVFTFCIALIIVWILCSFLYGTISIFYPHKERDSWGIQRLGEIARINPSPVTSEYKTPPNTQTGHQKYMSQTEVLNIVDAAFNTFSNKSTSPLNAIIAEEIAKQMSDQTPVQSDSTETVLQIAPSTEPVKGEFNNADILAKLAAQKDMIFQLEKSLAETNADHQQWRDKLVEQLQQKNAQLLILKNQEKAIQALKNKLASLEQASTKIENTEEATVTIVPDLKAVYEQIEKEATTQKASMDVFYQKIISVEKQFEAIPKPIAGATSAADFAPIYESIAKQTEDRKKAIDALYHKMVNLEMHQKQLDLFSKNKTTTEVDFSLIEEKLADLSNQQQATTNTLYQKIEQLEKRQTQSEEPVAKAVLSDVDFKPVYEKMKTVSIEQKAAIDALYHKIVSIEKENKTALTTLQSAAASIEPDFAPVYEKLNKLSKTQKSELKTLNNKIEQLAQTHQELIEQTAQQESTNPRFEQMFKNFDEILAQQESVLEDIKDNIITEEQVIAMLDNQATTPETLTADEVNELIEAAMSDGGSARNSDFVTRDQLQDGLMELAERVEEQLRGR